MSAWWTGAGLGFDLETDGPEPADARMITAATVLVTPGNPTQDIEVLIQPERDIPQGAIDVHHITTEHAREHGTARDLAIMNVALTIADLASPAVPLVGHNASYDLTVLDREMRRVGVGSLSTVIDDFGSLHQVAMTIEGKRVGVFPVIDTYVLDKALDRYRPGKRQLSFAAAHYGVPMAEGAAHGATADVLASLRIAWRMSVIGDQAAAYMNEHAREDRPLPMVSHPVMRLYGGRRDPLDIVRAFATCSTLSTTDLHEHETGWAQIQADGLREYFLSKGNKEAAATVDGSWPLHPVPAVETISTTVL